LKKLVKGSLTVLIVLLLVTLLFLSGVLGSFSPKHARLIYAANSGRFELAASRVLEQGGTSGIKRPNGVKDISLYTTRSGCVDFYMGGFGLVPSSTYWGVIYAMEDLPTGFQGLAVDFTREGEGWRWQEENGDNTCCVVKLADHWYWYEMSF